MLQAFDRKPYTGHSGSDETTKLELEPEEETKESGRIIETDQKVKELTEKLRFANETIANLIDAQEKKQKRRQSGDVEQSTK